MDPNETVFMHIICDYDLCDSFLLSFASQRAPLRASRKAESSHRRLYTHLSSLRDASFDCSTVHHVKHVSVCNRSKLHCLRVHQVDYHSMYVLSTMGVQ